MRVGSCHEPVECVGIDEGLDVLFALTGVCSQHPDDVRDPGTAFIFVLALGVSRERLTEVLLVYPYDLGPSSEAVVPLDDDGQFILEANHARRADGEPELRGQR